MPRRVAPTRTNLINLQKNLDFAREGHKLLEQKRDVLVAELMGLMDAVAEAQHQLDEELAAAHQALVRAAVVMGRHAVERTAAGVRVEIDVRTGERHVMGVTVPVVDTEIRERPLQYSLVGTSAALDDAAARFRRVLSHIGKLAQQRISLTILTREAAKTVRRVNALEKIYIPDFEETIDYVAEALEGAERDAFIMMKLVKARLEKKREQAH